MERVHAVPCAILSNEMLQSENVEAAASICSAQMLPSSHTVDQLKVSFAAVIG